MTITLRTQSQTGTTTKGSTLTHAELDDNFIDLLTNKIKPIDVRGDSGTQLVGQTLTNEVLQVLGGTGISTAVTSDSAGQAKIIITNTSSGATITDDTTTNATRYIVFDDVTTGSLSSVNVSSTKLTFNPSSGQMQVNELSTDSITSKSANSAIVIAPDGTGDVHLNTDSVRIGDNNTDATLVTRGTGDLILTTNEGSGTQGVIRIYDGANGNIELTPNGTGQVKIDYSLWPVSDGTTSQVLSTNGSGVLSWTTASVAISTGVTGLGSNVATFLATPSSANLISAITDETGTGALVFATSPTLVTPALGTPASGNLTNTTVDGTNPVGFRDLPAVGTKTSSYTLATGDVGKYVQVGSGGSITIPNSTFAEGDVVVIANNHTAAITITCTITDAYIGGTDTDKATVSLATRGVCNILFLSGTRCIITGNVS